DEPCHTSNAPSACGAPRMVSEKSPHSLGGILDRLHVRARHAELPDIAALAGLATGYDHQRRWHPDPPSDHLPNLCPEEDHGVLLRGCEPFTVPVHQWTPVAPVIDVG